MKKTSLCIVSLGLVLLSSCATNQGTGTAIGAGSGAALGAIAGNNVDGFSKGEGALVGAAVGGLLGNVMGRQQDQIDQASNRAESANTSVINIRNSNGSYSTVTLKRTPSGWVGPRGEFYKQKPSEQQLKQIYGF